MAGEARNEEKKYRPWLWKPWAVARCRAWLPRLNLFASLSLLAACLGCLSGRILEKPLISEKSDSGLSRHSFSGGGGVQPDLQEQAGKA